MGMPLQRCYCPHNVRRRHDNDQGSPIHTAYCWRVRVGRGLLRIILAPNWIELKETRDAIAKLSH
jgi:hypothetical protein